MFEISYGQAIRQGGKIPTLDLLVNLSIIFLSALASIFLITGIVFVVRLSKILQAFAKTIDPLIQTCLNSVQNLESVTEIIHEDVKEVHTSFRGLINGLKDASSQIEKRIGEVNSLVDLVHREIESVVLGVSGALKFLSRASRGKEKPPLESSSRSEET